MKYQQYALIPPNRRIHLPVCIGMVGKDTGHLLKRVKLYENFIYTNEALHMLRRN